MALYSSFGQNEEKLRRAEGELASLRAAKLEAEKAKLEAEKVADSSKAECLTIMHSLATCKNDLMLMQEASEDLSAQNEKGKLALEAKEKELED